MTHLKKLLLMVLLCSSAAVSAASMENFQSEEKAKQPNLHNSNVTNPVAPSSLGESAGGGSGAIKWITAFSGSTTGNLSIPSGGDFYEINGRAGASASIATQKKSVRVNSCRIEREERGCCGNFCSDNTTCKIVNVCKDSTTTKTAGSSCVASIVNGVVRNCSVTSSFPTGYCSRDKCQSSTPIKVTTHGVINKVRYLGL